MVSYNKIAKICEQTKLTWVQALPLALFAVRRTPKGLHGLSPYEILFGGRHSQAFSFQENDMDSMHL